MSESQGESWEGWDDPLEEVSRFLRASNPRVVAEELFRMALREETVVWMLNEGADPRDPGAARLFLGEHSVELNRAAHRRVLEFCSSIAGREG